MQVKTAPSAGTGKNRERQHTNEKSVLHCIEPVVVMVVLVEVASYVLMRKNDEGVEEHPPAEQHEKVQNTHQSLPVLANEIRPPGNRRDHGHGVKKKNNVEEERVGDRTMQQVLPDRPGCLVRDPQ